MAEKPERDEGRKSRRDALKRIAKLLGVAGAGVLGAGGLPRDVQAYTEYCDYRRGYIVYQDYYRTYDARPR